MKDEQKHIPDMLCSEKFVDNIQVKFQILRKM